MFDEAILTKINSDRDYWIASRFILESLRLKLELESSGVTLYDASIELNELGDIAYKKIVLIGNIVSVRKSLSKLAQLERIIKFINAYEKVKDEPANNK
jgi:hypothetical protein